MTHSSFAFAQPTDAPSVVISGSLNLPLSPNCSVVETPNPPFYVTKSATNAQGAPDGSLPQNTLVQLDTNNPDAATLANQGLMSVQVLSVPGAPSQLVGSHVHVSNHALLPATTTILGTLAAPGSLVNLDADKYVFVVRRDSPYFNIPALQGKSVRLAQDDPHVYPPMRANYFVKRCCSVQPSQTYTEQFYSRYTPKPYEEKQNPGCSYQPIFEVMKDIGTNGTSRYVPDGTFAASSSDKNCGGFTSALTPAGADSYHWLTTTVDQGVRYGQAWLNRLRTIAYDEMNKPRNGQPGGNHSKLACRAAVRSTLVRMGLLQQGQHPPTDTERPPWHPASGFTPWLGRQPGWQDMGRQFTSQTAPVGCVLVYGGAGAGHIEIRTQPNQYCSDYCSANPRDGGGADRSRPLTGIYCPRSS